MGTYRHREQVRCWPVKPRRSAFCSSNILDSSKRAIESDGQSMSKGGINCVCVEVVNSLPQGRSTILGCIEAKFRDRFQSVDGLPLVCWKVLYMVSGFLTSELCIVAKSHVC